MSRLVCTVALAGVAWTGIASAQEFKGAEVSAEVLSYTDDGDIAQTTYRGSLEFGVFGGFGVAADLSFYNFGDDESERNVTLHVLYDALAMATVGGFYSNEGYEDGSIDSFGIEAGRSMGAAGVEGYLGFADDEESSYRFLGLDAAYDISPNISLTGGFSVIDGDEVGSSRLSIGGEYRFGDGPAVYAQVGRFNLDFDGTPEDESETFIGVGARIAVGPNRGTTFDARGLTETLSGF
jgi:hypothetical protein